MTDDTEDDKKTDRVISMEDFKQSERKVERDAGNHKDIDDMTNLDVLESSEVLDLMKTADLSRVVVLGQMRDGKFRFGGNVHSYEEVIFMMEAYKKIILDNVVGQEYD